jgi:hypothetical protein
MSWYRNGHAVYVGKGDDLYDRISRRPMGQSRSLHPSALRRNVAEHLGFGSAQDIYNKVIRLDTDQLAVVRAWIGDCVLAWIECGSAGEAVRLEDDTKREWRPPLTTR